MCINNLIVFAGFEKWKKKNLHISDLNQRYGCQFDKLQLFPVYFSPPPVLFEQKQFVRLLSSFSYLTTEVWSMHCMLAAVRKLPLWKFKVYVSSAT